MAAGKFSIDFDPAAAGILEKVSGGSSSSGSRTCSSTAAAGAKAAM
jgi:hypothetical protein